MSAHTPAPWSWADVPGAGLQIRGPYKGSTRLLFSGIWRQFPEKAWDEEMVANTCLAAAAPELLEALEAMLEVHGVTQAYADKHIEIPQSWVEVSNVARAAIAKAGGAA